MLLIIMVISCEKLDLPKFSKPGKGNGNGNGGNNFNLVTNVVNAITTTGATVVGTNLNTVQKNAVLGFVWSTTNKIPSVDDNVINVTPVVGEFSASLTGLSPSTTYYVRAFFASNEVSPGKYANLRYGNVLTFKTNDISVPVFLTWSALGRNMQWNSNKGIKWDGVSTGIAYTFANQKLEPGKEVVAKIPDIVNDVYYIGISNTNNIDYPLWIYGVGLSNLYYEIHSGSSTSTSVAAAVGDWIKLKYSGSTITIERSTNNGSTWTIIATASFSASGSYYIGFSSKFGGPNEIYIQ